jgi:excisionase family DNA binding protein
MNEDPSVGQLRTKAEIARFLRVSEKTVQRRINSGKLRCLRDGGLLRITDQQLAEFLEQSETPLPIPAPAPVAFRRNPKYSRAS